MGDDGSHGFPPSFDWGTAASAPESEGAAFEGGKGLSVWDMFARKLGAIWDGSTPDVTSDVYHRYAEDAELMGRVGLTATRISICWPRVLPEGVGTPNPEGLDYYDRYVDALLAAGVRPIVNLFHWDYPLDLYRRGGWLNRDSVDWFADYADLMVRRLSDRVVDWMTFNEPQIFVGYGHLDGSEPPGDRLALPEVLRVSHHALMAHGKAVQAIRANSKQETRVSLVFAVRSRVPETDTPEDIEATRRAMFSVTEKNFRNTTWFADPVFLGEYPEDGWELFGADVPSIGAGDMELIAQPLDYYGLNTYSGQMVRADEDGEPELLPHSPENPMNTWGWYVMPSILYWSPKFFHERYGVTVDVTENGYAGRDWVNLDGGIHDFDRIDYTRRHLLHLERAIAEGIPVGGYYMWTFVDDYCWTEAYKDRMGLVHRHAVTQERTPKDSAFWFSEVIRTNGGAIHEDPMDVVDRGRIAAHSLSTEGRNS
jgi:beta-glucosidase